MHITAEYKMLVWRELPQPHPGSSQVQRKDFAFSRVFAKETQLIITVKNRLHSSCTTSFFGPAGRGIETRFRCALQASHWGIRTLPRCPCWETEPDWVLLLWIVKCAVLTGFLVCLSGSCSRQHTHHLDVWPSPTGRRKWWNKACSLPVLMLFLLFVFFFCPCYSAAAKRSRRVALRACAARCCSRHPLLPHCFVLHLQRCQQ